QAQIKTAEGDRQAAILRAEGARQAAILEAEGRAQAVTTVYKAITDANPNPTLVSILQLDTLSKFAASENAKLIVPVETAGGAGAAPAPRRGAGGVPSGGQAQKKPPGPTSRAPFPIPRGPTSVCPRSPHLWR